MIKMSNNQMLVGTNKKLKIFKTATQVSIMDVEPTLDYHKEKNNEMSYRGSISFLINEYGGSKESIRTYLPKSKCKMICNMIIDGSFANMFPPKEGFVEYGGSAVKKLARTLRITFELNQSAFAKSRYVFQIDEGEAVIGKNGQISMKKRLRSVRTYVNIYQAIEMAHEIIDYIRHEELISLINDKPLYTWNTYQANNQLNGNSGTYNQQNNQQYNNDNQFQQNQQQVYQDPFGNPPPVSNAW